MLDSTALFWSFENLEPRGQVFFESAALDQKILGGWRQPSAIENLRCRLNKWQGSVEISKRVKTSGFVQGTAVSFSKSTWNSAQARPQVRTIRLTENLVIKGISQQIRGDLRIWANKYKIVLPHNIYISSVLQLTPYWQVAFMSWFLK